MNSRVKKLQLELAKLSIDGFLAINPYNISYLAGYKCRDSYLLITPEKANVYNG